MRLIQGVAAASTLAASVIAFAGSTATVASASPKVTIAFNVGAEADPFFQSMYLGAAAEAKKLGQEDCLRASQLFTLGDRGQGRKDGGGPWCQKKNLFALSKKNVCAWRSDASGHQG